MHQTSQASANPSDQTEVPKTSTRVSPRQLATIIDTACKSAAASGRDSAYLVRRANGKADSVLIIEKGSSRTVVVIDLTSTTAYVPLDAGDLMDDFEVCPSGGSHRFHGDSASAFFTDDGLSLKYAYAHEKVFNFIRIPILSLLLPADRAALEIFLTEEKVHPDLAEWMDREGLAELSLSLKTGALYFRRNNGSILDGLSPTVPPAIREFFGSLYSTVRENDEVTAFIQDLTDMFRAA